MARIEQSALGTVFICNYGGPKHGSEGCRRTYLSSRDLQAHVYHRHLREAQQAAQVKAAAKPSVPLVPPGGIEKYSTSKSSVKVHDSGIIEQYTTAAGRHGVPDMSLGQTRVAPADPSRMFQQPPAMMSQMPSMATAPPMLGQGPPPQLPNTSQPPPIGIPPPQMNVTQHDAFGMTQGVMQPRGTNLITIQVQDDTDYRRRDQPNYMQAGVGGIPPVTFSTAIPPPSGSMPPMQANFPSSMRPPTSFGLPPTSVPPPFSSPPMGQNSSGNLSRPPPGVPAPNLNAPPPHLGPRMPIPGTQPPRFGAPFEDKFSQPPPGGQNPRGPWTGPSQRGPPPHGGSGSRGPPPQYY